MNVLAKKLLQCRPMQLLDRTPVLSSIGTLAKRLLLKEHLQEQHLAWIPACSYIVLVLLGIMTVLLPRNDAHRPKLPRVILTISVRCPLL